VDRLSPIAQHPIANQGLEKKEISSCLFHLRAGRWERFEMALQTRQRGGFGKTSQVLGQTAEEKTVNISFQGLAPS